MDDITENEVTEDVVDGVDTENNVDDSESVVDTGESERLVDLRRRLAMYKDMETNILTGAAQSYNVGNRTLSRYGVSLSEVRATIKEIEEEINAEIKGSSRWSGNMFPIDD